MNKILKSISVILFTTLFCSCSESEQADSLPQSSVDTTESAVYDTSPENEISSSVEGAVNIYPEINKHHYTPEGYADKDQRYLVLSELKITETDVHYVYYIYDESENKVVNSFACENEGLSFCDGTLTFSCYRYEEGNNDERYVHYEVTDIFGNILKKSEEQKFFAKDYIYAPSEDAMYFVYEDSDNKTDNGLYKTDASGNTICLTQYIPSKTYILDDEIVCYYIQRATLSGDGNACYFVVMDKNGTETRKVNIGAFTSARRLIKAGDYICFMSPLETERDVISSDTSNGIILYNYKTNEMRVQYFDKPIENSYCGITPDGRYLITCVPHDIKVTDVALPYHKREDTVINVYDTATGGKLISEELGINGLHPTSFDAFNEGVSIVAQSRYFYKLK